MASSHLAPRSAAVHQAAHRTGRFRLTCSAYVALLADDFWLAWAVPLGRLVAALPVLPASTASMSFQQATRTKTETLRHQGAIAQDIGSQLQVAPRISHAADAA